MRNTKALPVSGAQTIISLRNRNDVLATMAAFIRQHEKEIIRANQKDIQSFVSGDKAMTDRLKVDAKKVAGMATALEQLATQKDPLGIELFSHIHTNGMRISNKTAPFGTILIIYESRPDVTIEAAGIAFKSGNKILLKGGKEAVHSNEYLVSLWHKALAYHNITTDKITYLNYNREQIQAFLKQPNQKLDIIIPRGGERLIAFVKEHAACPIIVSGRGNNFVYVHKEADRALALDIILNGKIDKISACNAVDKVLVDKELPNREDFISNLVYSLKSYDVEVLGDHSCYKREDVMPIEDDRIWHEEFLDYKIAIGGITNLEEATSFINTYSGGHSASIITRSESAAELFMASVDCAAVYHNVSTRFTDGFEFGLGGELAISTDKLHHRGPMGLQHMVTNKWYVHGEGQIR